VFWSSKYNAEGNFVSSVKKGNDGAVDSPEGYFKGIGLLKKLSKSNLNIF